MEEEENLEISRHFFKVIMPSSLTKLSVPQSFGKKLIVGRSGKASLTSSMGTWLVQISRSSEGLICFEAGWGEFVRRHSLNIGDFVVFEHRGGMKFHVLLFDPSACEKEEEDCDELSGDERESVPGAKQIKEENPLEEADASDSPGKPFFTATMLRCNGSSSTHRLPYMNIPQEFARSNEVCRYRSVTLRDPKGKLWLVGLNSWPVKKPTTRTRTSMGNGWHEFYVANKLKEGDVCRFELNPTTGRSDTPVMDVRIFPVLD